MWKNSLAIFVLGSLVTGSSFAIPLQVKKMLMKDQVMQSSLVSNHYTQDSKFKFSGTWAGVCNYGGENQEVKIKIKETNDVLFIINLTNEGQSNISFFNIVESEGGSSKDWYNSFTSRLTRVNENILRLEGTGMAGIHKDKGFSSVLFTSMYTVNNNQLTIDTNVKISRENKDNSIESNCTLKRVG